MNDLHRLLLVCLGSALGGGARYLVATRLPLLLGTAFPFATLTVNVTGSFLIALILEVGTLSTPISPEFRLFLTTGILGGFTTYSTFNYETLQAFTTGSAITGLLYLAVTVVGCLAAGVLGLAAGRLVFPT